LDRSEATCPEGVRLSGAEPNQFFPGVGLVKVARKGMKKAVVDAEMDLLQRSRDGAVGKMLRCRVRYFTDGAVIGSRGFVDEVFRMCRERFGGTRKDGARK
jgi:hypothetical protein